VLNILHGAAISSQLLTTGGTPIRQQKLTVKCTLHVKDTVTEIWMVKPHRSCITPVICQIEPPIVRLNLKTMLTGSWYDVNSLSNLPPFKLINKFVCGGVNRFIDIATECNSSCTFRMCRSFH